MTETLTQNLGDQLQAALADRRRRDEQSVTDIIDRSHSPRPSDAVDLAALVEKLDLDPKDVRARISDRIERHAHEQRLDGLRARHAELRAEVYGRERWNNAFGAIEKLDGKLGRLADGAVATGYSDPQLLLPEVAEVVPDYLHARGWIQIAMTPAIFKIDPKDERGLIAATARDRQFAEDLAPLKDALNSYPHSFAPPDAQVGDSVLESEVAALTARLESLPPIDPHAARLVRIAQAAVTLYVHQPREAAPINRAQSVLCGELPKILAAVAERLSLAAQRAVFGKKE